MIRSEARIAERPYGKNASKAAAPCGNGSVTFLIGGTIDETVTVVISKGDDKIRPSDHITGR